MFVGGAALALQFFLSCCIPSLLLGVMLLCLSPLWSLLMSPLSGAVFPSTRRRRREGAATQGRWREAPLQRRRTKAARSRHRRKMKAKPTRRRRTKAAPSLKEEGEESTRHSRKGGKPRPSKRGLESHALADPRRPKQSVAAKPRSSPLPPLAVLVVWWRFAHRLR